MIQLGPIPFFRQLLIQTLYQMRSRYRHAWTGMLWVTLGPIMIFTIQYFIFNTILGLKSQYYAFYLLSGLLPWLFMSSSLEVSVSALTYQAPLLKTYPLNPFIMILSRVLDNFINCFFSLIFLAIPLGLILDTGFKFQLINLLIPLLLFIAFLFTSALSLFLSFYNTRFQDIKFITSFMLKLVFFTTPIFYEIKMIPKQYRIFAEINPFYHAIELIRIGFALTPSSHFVHHFIILTLITSVLFLAALNFWKTNRNECYQ